jgi:outer membrane protein TolC
MTVDMLFDWNDSLEFALTNRLELRRQKWVVKQRELERTAAWNLTRPQLDFIGLYRRNGFGNDLFGNNQLPFSSAMESVVTDSLDGWQIGMELRTPIGNRLGHTALRNAELRLIRERAIYREQELAISHELSGAIAELDRAYMLVRTNYNRRIAALEQVDAVRRKFDTGITPLEFLLDAIRRATEADSAYYRLLADYNQAVANVHLTRGSFLASHGVFLTEGPWSVLARQQADRLVRRVQRRGLNHGYTSPPLISAGPYDQHPIPPTKPDTLEVIEVIEEIEEMETE